MKFMATSQYLGSTLKKQLPPGLWDGKKCIIEMQESGCKHWKQMEWIGFYYQFLCEKFLCEAMDIPGPSYGKTKFDGFREIPWDFKAHAMNTSSHNVIINDKAAIVSAIQDFGAVGLILALGEVEYNDESRNFQQWHSEQKGGQSKYEKDRKSRGAWSRRRKVSFALKQIMFIPITNDTVSECGSFQKDFRNSDGNPRRSKILINLEKIDEENIHFIDFG